MAIPKVAQACYKHCVCFLLIVFGNVSFELHLVKASQRVFSCKINLKEYTCLKETFLSYFICVAYRKTRSI